MTFVYEVAILMSDDGFEFWSCHDVFRKFRVITSFNVFSFLRKVLVTSENYIFNFPNINFKQKYFINFELRLLIFIL